MQIYVDAAGVSRKMHIHPKNKTVDGRRVLHSDFGLLENASTAVTCEYVTD